MFRPRVGQCLGLLAVTALVLGVFGMAAAATVKPTTQKGLTQLFPSVSPSPRKVLGQMVYDTTNGVVLLFGGHVPGTSTYLNDTWTWNGSTWAQQLLASSPPPRDAAGMAYDAAIHAALLFGGQTSTGFGGTLGDAWTWDGTTRTQQSPSSPPSPRWGVAAAYDEARGDVVMFGGTGSGGSLSETWTWSGTSWTLQSPVTSPTPRYNAAMAYDSKDRMVVLFGGNDGAGHLLRDTWIWDGANWYAQGPLSSPAKREAPGLAYDPTIARVVLFGGNGASGALNDTWAWNGTNWRQGITPSQPPARYGAGLAYDLVNYTLVLFGGHGVSSALNDTWILQ